MRHLILLLLSIFLTVDSTAQTFERANVPAFSANKHNSNSASWADYDKDGDLDLFVTNGESDQPNEFYINDGKGNFTSISNNITEKSVPSFGGVWGDYDNDGWLDLYVVNCRYQEETGAHNFLFKNNGDGSFKEIKGLVPTEDWHTSYGAAWVDYNNDGWLDLYVTNAYGWNNKLYKNNGDGTFESITDSPVSSSGGHNISCAWSDFDNDGDIDVLVINTSWSERTALYENKGDGTFSKYWDPLLHSLILTWSRSASWGDYNNDGWMDLILTDREGDDILLKNIAGSFERVEAPDFQVEGIFSGNTSQWGDFDNDGYVDLLLLHHIDEHPEFHYNNGDGTFTKMQNAWTEPGQGSGYSCTAIDVNLDGKLDIFQTNRFRATGGTGPEENMLFLNTSEDCNQSLMISLRGIQSNSFGLGAKIFVHGLRADGSALMQKQELSALAGGGYINQKGTTLHFGIADVEKIDSIVVHWPSQEKTTYQEIEVNKHFLLYEDGRREIVDDLALSIFSRRSRNCVENINQLNVKNAIGEVTWRKDGVVIGQGEQLDIPLEVGTFLYTAEDICGQLDSLLIINEDVQYSFFPNPAHELINFLIQGNLNVSEAQFTIYDASGKLITAFEMELEDGINEKSIWVDKFTAGYYAVKIKTDCWEVVEKLVIISKD